MHKKDISDKSHFSHCFAVTENQLILCIKRYCEICTYNRTCKAAMSWLI